MSSWKDRGRDIGITIGKVTERVENFGGKLGHEAKDIYNDKIVPFAKNVAREANNFIQGVRDGFEGHSEDKTAPAVAHNDANATNTTNNTIVQDNPVDRGANATNATIEDPMHIGTNTTNTAIIDLAGNNDTVVTPQEL